MGLVEPGADLSWMRSRKIRWALSSEKHLWTSLEILVYRGTRFTTQGGSISFQVYSCKRKGDGGRKDRSGMCRDWFPGQPLGLEFSPGPWQDRLRARPTAAILSRLRACRKLGPLPRTLLPYWLWRALIQPCADYILLPPSLLSRAMNLILEGCARHTSF